MADLLAVRGLRVDYRTGQGLSRVLDGVSLEVGRGEVVGLVGESGCGKSTLARAILGVLPAPAAEVPAGEIVFDAQDLRRADPDEVARSVRGRRITFIPQDPFGSLNPLFTVGQQMGELMRWKSSLRGGRQRAAILDMLREVQIPDPEQALTKLPHELSGGQRQRILIAMALLPQPDLIIADEPTTALDVTVQAQILRLLFREVKRRGVSVLFTTHDLGTAWELCDRIVVMYAGQEVEAAPTAAFFAAPRHPYTAQLLESLPRSDRPMKDIPGEIPSLIDAPSGCRFHPRCAYATSICAAERPGVDGRVHVVRCHHPLAGEAAGRAS